MKRIGICIVVIAAIAVAGLIALQDGPTVAPSGAEIREVWEHHELYEGKSLRVSGTLRRFLEGQPKEHFVVESADGYRIGVEAEGLEGLDGAQVAAEGRVTFDEESGLRLAAASVAAL